VCRVGSACSVRFDVNEANEVEAITEPTRSRPHKMTESDDSVNIQAGRLRMVAALLGLSGVGLGAIGAHALQARLVQRGMLESWKTAVLYQLFHAAALLSVCTMAKLEESSSSSSLSTSKLSSLSSAASAGALLRAGQLMGIGTVLFSGSIYLLCLGVGPRKLLGPTTPVGGLVMMSGWALLLLPRS
jgi:uncharacterized membrane protein YgdD (TMEM256/DUF423 family)